jgi:hypothetical protein
MAKTITLVEGDTSGPIRIPQLEDANGVVDLAGLTVTAQIREVGSGAVIEVTTDVDAPAVEFPPAQRANWPAGTYEVRVYVAHPGSPAPRDVFPSADRRFIQILPTWAGSP